MKNQLFKRKMYSTLLSSVLITILLSLSAFFSLGEGTEYHRGNSYLGWVFLLFMYIAPIILLYGNVVSLIIEFVLKKMHLEKRGLSLFLHGLFGLANGMLFSSWIYAIMGAIAALSYVLIDRWVSKRLQEKKRMTSYILAPLLFLGLAWGGLEWASPAQPPFTIEDAVKSAIEGDDLRYGFPKGLGSHKETIEGYQVEWKISAKEIGEEKYNVSFSENWKKDGKESSWYYSYDVEKHGLTASSSGGGLPPYYGNDD